MNWQSMILVGRVVRPHGRRGGVVIAPETDFAEDRFKPGAAVFVRRADLVETLTVVESFPLQGRWVARFESVQSIEDAERLRDAELRIDAGALRALEADRFYVHDLIGCRVETVDGAAIGTVRDVEMSAGTPLLVVEPSDAAAGETLVPMAEEICRRVDLAARTITIAPPDGLIELNRPSQKRR